jgi:hypothetical protein
MYATRPGAVTRLILDDEPSADPSYSLPPA